MKIKNTQGDTKYTRLITKHDILMLFEYEEAAGYRFNRMPDNAFLDLLEEGKQYPVQFAFVHNGVEMRCNVMAKPGIDCFVDMPFSAFFRLPVMDKQSGKFASGQPPVNLPALEPEKGYNIVYMLAKPEFSEKVGHPEDILFAEVTSLDEMTCHVWSADKKSKRTIKMAFSDFFALPTRIEEWDGWNE